MEKQDEIKTKKTPQNVLDSVSKYQKNNKQKINEKSKRAYYRLKEDPIRYQAFKDKRKHNRLLLKQKKIQEQQIVD